MARPGKDAEDIIRRLIPATENGQLKWELQGADTFVLRSPTGSISIESVQQDATHPYRFFITNSDGNIVEVAETSFGEPYASWERRLARLYELARNNALGLDALFRGLKKDLNLDEVPPEDDEDSIPF